MLLDGIFLPVLTPFHADGRLFAAKLETNVDRYGRTPAAGLMVLGRSISEAGALNDREVEEVLRTAIAASNPAQVMIAGVSAGSVRTTLERAEMAARAGYDVVAIRKPDPAMDSEQIFFEMVADRSPLPVLLIHEEPAELLSRVAAHPNILGAFDLSGTEDGIRQIAMQTTGISREVRVTTTFRAVTGRMLRAAGASGLVSADSLAHGTGTATPGAEPAFKTRLKKVGFQILGGSDERMLEQFDMGASGSVPALGVCVPQACCEVFQALRDGDRPLAEEKQHRLRAALAAFTGVAALKYGCDLNGYFGGRPRLPGLPIDAEQRHAVEQALAGMRN